MAGGQRDQFAPIDPRTAGDDEAAIRGSCKRSDAALDIDLVLTRVVDIDRAHLDAERRRDSLDRAELTRPSGRDQIAENCCSFDARRNLLEQLEPFPAHAVFEIGEAGGVATAMGEHLDETAADRIGDLYEYDRNATGGLQHRPGGRTADGQEDVGRKCD